MTNSQQFDQSGSVRKRGRLRIGLMLTSVAIVGILVYLAVDRVIYSRDAVFEGKWVMDAETIAWLGRTCALMYFDEQTVSGFAIRHANDEVEVQFNNRAATTFVGRRSGGRVIVQQMVPATETGRFCGDPIRVRIRMSIRATEPEVIRAAWTLPQCDVCPDQSFVARRIGTASE